MKAARRCALEYNSRQSKSSGPWGTHVDMDVAADVLVTVRGRLEDDGELSVNVSGCKHTQAFPDSLAADSLLKETNLYVVCV